MDDKRDRIISVAEKIFAKFGIQKSTMDEIAKNARMGKSTLYYYFKSKEELFAAVIQKDSALLRQRLIEAISRADTPQQKISNYIYTRMKHLKELSNYYQTLSDEFLDHYAFVEKARREFIDFEISTLKNLLQSGIDQGVFASIDVEITSRNFAIALKGLEYPLLILNQSADIKKESNQLLNILFKGIEVR